MTNSSDIPQLPSTDPLQNPPQLLTGNWYEYPVTAHPHTTDYAGIVWHGSYIAWLEEARVECLAQKGINFAELVAWGCDLPVVELAIRYHQPIQMGTRVIVKTQMAGINGVRVNWDYQIQSADGKHLYATARVTLVPVDREKGKIMRQLPAAVKDALTKLADG